MERYLVHLIATKHGTLSQWANVTFKCLLNDDFFIASPPHEHADGWITEAASGLQAAAAAAAASAADASLSVQGSSATHSSRNQISARKRAQTDRRRRSLRDGGRTDSRV